MYIWEVLGIEPTADIVVIKRAFAQKAKKYHPEEYPEEYKALRNAYKKAVEYAKLQESVMATQNMLSGGRNPQAKQTEEAAETPHREISELRTAHLDNFFREELTLEEAQAQKDPVKKVYLESPQPKRPSLEMPKLEDLRPEPPHLEAPVPQRPSIKDNLQRTQKPHLEVPHPEMPHLKKPSSERPPVRKPRIESINLEIPHLRELMLEHPSITPIYIEDPSLLQLSDKQRRRSRLQAVPKQLDFSFEEVERAFSPEEIDEFFYLFRAIAGNPILRDNIECWALFLERDEIQDLFRKEDVCHRMMDTIEKYFWGKKETLLYFEFFLTIKTGKKMQETQTFKWELKKLFSALPKCNELKLLSEEELRLHNTILDDLRKRNIAYDLVHFEAARTSYLGLFLSLMRENWEEQQQKWQKKWQEAQQEREIKGLLYLLQSLAVPLAVIILVLLLFIVLFSMGQNV